MRAILVDWLVDVVSEFKLNRDTLFLCVFYVDRYLSASGSLARNKLQLLGVTTLLIAAYLKNFLLMTLQENMMRSTLLVLKTSSIFVTEPTQLKRY